MEFNKIINRVIEIEASANGGFKMDIGCCMLVYTDIANLLRDLEQYLEDPEGVAAVYNKTINPLSGSSPSYQGKSISSS